MRTPLVAISALLLSCMAAAAQDAAPVQICQLPLLASLPTVVLPAGKISVPVNINGRDVGLMVDTGDVVSGVTDSTVAQLNLSTHEAPIRFKMLGGIEVTQMARGDGLKIGNLAAPRFDFLVLPDRAIDSNSAGLLGPDIMSNYDIEFDFAHARFNFFAPNACPGRVVYWTKDVAAQIPMHVDRSWHITVPVSIDGKNLTAMIDSGAEHSTMNLSTAKALFGITPADPGMKQFAKASINGARPVVVYHYHFGALTLDGVAVNNPSIDILPDEAYNDENPQLLIGISILRQLRVYIAYKEQMLYATSAEAH